jgi:radical SAM protein with 4Fe4S-binding SPASM domain
MNLLKGKPSNAAIAVTYRCNSRCLNCDVWRSNNCQEVQPEIYSKLPSSLRQITITGGEPLLRPDLIGVLEQIKKACPKVTLTLLTNGLLPERLKKILPKIKKIDKRVSIRVSLDGLEDSHDQMRGVSGAFKKATETIQVCKQEEIENLGVIFTLSKKNYLELEKVINFSQQENLRFSFNLLHSSPIVFGTEKHRLSSQRKAAITCIKKVKENFFPPKSISEIGKFWFYSTLEDFVLTKKRPVPCLAAEGFFYMDPAADVYSCHFKDWKLGNLAQKTFQEIWESPVRKKIAKRAENCLDCYMICSTKTAIKEKKWLVLKNYFLKQLFSFKN